MKMTPLILLLVGVSGLYCVTLCGIMTLLSPLRDPGCLCTLKSDMWMIRWMKKEEPEYWERQTQRCQSNEAVSKHGVQTLMSRFNQTKGFHSYQLMYGCELRDDGSTAGYMQYGYDGRDFVYLDTQSGLWIPTMNGAEITTQRWNSPEVREGERHKNYLENICIDWLKKHINNGREDLEKRVRPEVKVWGRPQPDGAIRLQCLVYGFHPRAVDVKWMKNGIDHVPSDETTPILPHPDGTYQMRVCVEVPTTEGDTYSCHVEHSSLGKETLIVKWDPTGNGLPVAVIVGVVIGIIVLLGIIIGVVLWIKKNKTDYESTNTSDTGSDRSKQVKA